MKKEILEVRLKGNCADTRDGVLRLGGAQSYGIYRLHITADEAWQGLAIAATFDCGGSPVTVVPAEDGLLDVPAEATASANTSCHPGSITFWGSNGDVRRVSARLLYRVYPTGSITGGNAIPPTPEVAEQLPARLDGKLDTPANTGAAGQVPVLQPDGSTLWGSVAGGTGTGGAVGADGGYYTPSVDDAGNLSWTASKTDMPAVNGANIMGPAGADGQPGADGAPGPVGATPNIQIGTVETLAAGSAATASMTGTAENPMLNLGIPKGADGQPGADGKDGLDGSPGADGKSAYQYAVEGGYTGTETEFAAKLAQEIPSALPNPNSLTFTGAATGTYDGSAPVSVEIPSGGGSSGGGMAEETIMEITLTEDVSDISEPISETVKTKILSCKQIRFEARLTKPTADDGSDRGNLTAGIYHDTWYLSYFANKVKCLPSNSVSYISYQNLVATSDKSNYVSPQLQCVSGENISGNSSLTFFDWASVARYCGTKSTLKISGTIPIGSGSIFRLIARY